MRAKNHIKPQTHELFIFARENKAPCSTKRESKRYGFASRQPEITPKLAILEIDLSLFQSDF